MSRLQLILFVVLTAVPVGCDRLDYKDTAKQNAVKYQLEAFSNAMKRYAADTGHVPDESCGLRDLVENCGSRIGWNGPYISRIPADPWGVPFEYIVLDAPRLAVEFRSSGMGRGTEMAGRGSIVLREWIR